MNDLIQNLRKAVRTLCDENQNLGSVDGSYGWNAAYAKVEAAEQEYEKAISAIQAAFQVKKVLDNIGE